LICGSILPQIILIFTSYFLHIYKGELKKDYTQLKEQFGKHLKKIRQEKNLPLRTVATNCDLDDSQISKIENGVWDIQLSTIFELAKGLNVEPKDLLDFKI